MRYIRENNNSVSSWREQETPHKGHNADCDKAGEISELHSGGGSSDQGGGGGEEQTCVL